MHFKIKHLYYLFLCSRSAVDQIYVTVSKMPPENVALYERRRRIVTTIIWFATTLTIAVILPNIGIVIDFLGSFAALFAFFFPGEYDYNPNSQFSFVLYSFLSNSQKVFIKCGSL